MRRLSIIFCAGFLALGFVSFTTLSASAETSEQGQPTGGASTLESSTDEASFISQGSAVDADSAQLDAIRADVAEEERLPDYSQVVDNGTAGSFSAPGWQVQSDAQGADPGQTSHGGSFATSGSAKAPAGFEVEIPTSNDYTVYAWWPALPGNSKGASFGIDTASGTQWTSVDQSIEGGDWIKLGTYSMTKGERSIKLSAGTSQTGATVADAVAVVRGDVTAPPGVEGSAAGGDDGTFSTAAIRNPNGGDVVRVARRFMGTSYRWGTCTSYRMSCTCETKKTYKRFGQYMGMTENGQWKHYRQGAKRIWHKRNIRRGDEVFFREGGGRITHVAIYSGNGNVVHASSYYGKVVESKMKYINGYTGAKRYRLH